MNEDAPQWLTLLRQQSAELGFSDFGVCPALDANGFTDLVEWIESGYAADMAYFRDRLDAYRNPCGVMSGVKSIVVMTYPYPADEQRRLEQGHGRVARYAWSGIDYHDTIHAKLKQLRKIVQTQDPSVQVRGCVDTAPLLERELAQLAGIGWRGKNTLTLSRTQGSYFFIACLLIDVELPYNEPHSNAHCGTCTACLDACPTDAFPRPGVLDASRCISYLTIENRDSIPAQFRDGIGEWLFGCDICQEVCPWNRKRTRGDRTMEARRPFESIDLRQFFTIDEEEFRRRFRKSPLWRTRLRGIRRNAAVVLGNRRDAGALEVLREAARGDDPIVAEACRWAIEQIESGIDD